MSPEEALSQQFFAFHGAVIDSCNRAARPDRSDTMALRLRNNALALTRMQLAIMALPKAGASQTDVEVLERVDEAPQQRVEANLLTGEADPPTAMEQEPERAEPWSMDSDRVLSGDALSRFVSRPLAADESAHEVWQRMQESAPSPRRRNAALPGAGFRSSSS